MGVPADWYKHRLFDACETLHSAVTGSGDPLADDDLAELVLWLRRRYEGWCQPPTTRGEPFDNAAKVLVNAAIEEGIQEQARRQLEVAEG